MEAPAEFLRSGAHNALTLSGQGLQLEFWEGTDYVRLTEGDALRFYRADRINELLRQYAGITLDDLRTDWRSDPRTPYLSEYDAFYNFTSDFGPGTFYPAYGYRNGEEITLLEAGYFGDMLILAERPDGGFWFVEHSPSGRVPQGF